MEHIGSTSVPGLPAKDCLDIMVQVPAIEGSPVAGILAAAGFRQRPEPWNREETSYGVVHRKQVFAPAVERRSCNIHVREQGGLNVRYTLLFRDYLRADAPAADAWGRFKTRLAQSVDDLANYGQIKAPAQEILLRAAERRSIRRGVSPPATSRPTPATIRPMPAQKRAEVQFREWSAARRQLPGQSLCLLLAYEA